MKLVLARSHAISARMLSPHRGGDSHTSLFYCLGQGIITENRFNKHQTTTCPFTRNQPQGSSAAAGRRQPLLLDFLPRPAALLLVRCYPLRRCRGCSFPSLLFLSAPPAPSFAALSFGDAPLSPPHPLLLFLSAPPLSPRPIRCCSFSTFFDEYRGV